MTPFRSKRWKFSIFLDYGSNTPRLVKYTPKNDFGIVSNKHSISYVIGENASSESETDKWWMLMHALVLVRLGTKFLNDKFVVMAIYITNNFVAERFLAFQDGNGQV